MPGTGYHLQIRHSRHPNTSGWIWRITDDLVNAQQESPTDRPYNTKDAAATAGQEALMGLLGEQRPGPGWVWFDGIWGIQRDQGDDPTEWHTINTGHPRHPEPPALLVEPDRRRQHPLNANPTTMDGLVWEWRPDTPVDVDPEPLIEPPEPGTR